MIRTLGQTVAALLVVTAIYTPQAWAQEAPQRTCYPTCITEVEGGDGGLTATATTGVSEKVPNRGTPATHGAAPGRREWLTVEEYVTPTCTGNTHNGADALCTTALTTCPADDQLRYWIWHTTDRFVRDDAGVVTQQLPAGTPQQLPGSFCLGPDDPGVPTIGQVIAQVQSEFRNLPLPVAGVQVDPAPTTLVHIPTAFFAGGPPAATFSPTILGTTVTISATASRWDWTWGDGTSGSTSTPGVPKRPVVSHTYDQARDHQVGRATTWTGTFTVAGSSEVFPIRTPAVVTSAPVTVQVREARTELVGG